MGVHFHTYMNSLVIITSLLGGLEPWNSMTFILGMTFHIYVYIYIHIGNVIIPTDELIFFRGVQPVYHQPVHVVWLDSRSCR